MRFRPPRFALRNKVILTTGRLFGHTRHFEPLPDVGWDFSTSGYVRPHLETPQFLDDAGQVIHYGERWGNDRAPDDTYSVVSHPERFAPLIEVADAMIDFLTGTYEVTMTDVPNLEDEREPRFPGIKEPRFTEAFGPTFLRAIKLTPQRPDEAPLIIAFTSFPGIHLWAGALYELDMPDCGCDACDDDWTQCAEVLESNVLAVVNGTFSELWRGRRLVTNVAYPEGASGSTCQAKYLPYSAAYIAKARHKLRDLPNGWQPWTRRQLRDRQISLPRVRPPAVD